MKIIQITNDIENQRVDKFLRKYLKNAPLSFIYKLFRKKDVKINNHWVKENYILKNGDELKFYVTDEQIEEFNKPIDIEELNYNLDIVYEDENILIINKEKGILVTNDDQNKLVTLTEIVQNYLFKKGEFKNDGISFVPSPVHRLDRNTSGLCIFAKNLPASQILFELFKTHENIEKRYLALVLNKPDKIEGIVDAPLLKDEVNKTVKVDFKNRNSKSALTEYKIIDSNNKLSLLDVNLKTGRTHQIRVHLSYIGCPIVGDTKYGDFEYNKYFEEKYKYTNQFLHAFVIKFKHVPGILNYLSNKEFKGNIPENEKIILNNLGLEVK